MKTHIAKLSLRGFFTPCSLKYDRVSVDRSEIVFLL